MKFSISVGLFAALMLTLHADSPAPAPASAPPAATNSPADAAWAKIGADMQAMRSTPPTSEADSQTRVAALFKEADDFITKFPNDPRAVNATLLWAQIGQAMTANHIAGAPSDEEVSKRFEALATNQKLPKDQRATLRAVQINLAMRKAATSSDAAAWDAVEARFAVFEKEFGADYAIEGHSVVPILRGQELNVLAKSSDQVRYKALVQKLGASTDPAISALAKQASAPAPAPAPAPAAPTQATQATQ